MANAKKSGYRSFLFGGFSRINGEGDARSMAKAGGVAGFLLTLSEALGSVAMAYGLDPTTWKATPKADVHSLEFIIGACFSGAFVLLLIFMSWRTYVGKGYVSSILLAALLAYEGYSKVVGGTLGGGWAVVYIGLFISLIGALRAAWYLGKARKAAKTVQAAEAF